MASRDGGHFHFLLADGKCSHGGSEAAYRPLLSFAYRRKYGCLAVEVDIKVSGKRGRDPSPYNWLASVVSFARYEMPHATPWFLYITNTPRNEVYMAMEDSLPR